MVENVKKSRANILSITGEINEKAKKTPFLKGVIGII